MVSISFDELKCARMLARVLYGFSSQSSDPLKICSPGMSGVGRRMKRGCLKRSCPFGEFCGEHSRRTVPRLSASRTSRRSDPEVVPDK
ncbi:hypothetical protein F2Q69_00054205 [Brassica cretica]|uniref:Uncharacterized protein n=1 Tax=Brassica cretica TaxID=69181 RepID=A0A8S9NBG3_BRACR|nr:hypothetical protein F2Q69_00054205 [Brassica cretica]